MDTVANNWMTIIFSIADLTFDITHKMNVPWKQHQQMIPMNHYKKKSIKNQGNKKTSY